jgi:hypothetical protein
MPFSTSKLGAVGMVGICISLEPGANNHNPVQTALLKQVVGADYPLRSAFP